MTKLWGIVKGRRSLKYYTRFKFWSTRNERKKTSTAIQNEINLTKVINLAGNNKKSLHRLGLCYEKQQEEKNLGGISWPRNNPGLPAPQEACKTHQIRYFLQIYKLASSAQKNGKTATETILATGAFSNWNRLKICEHDYRKNETIFIWKKWGLFSSATGKLKIHRLESRIKYPTIKGTKSWKSLCVRIAGCGWK